jgi:DNA end-binding protein Ku
MAYALLCEAMEATNKVVLGRFVMRPKQYVAAIRSLDGRLVMSTLVYANELIDPTGVADLDTVRDVEVSDKERAMAEMLVESLTSTFDVTKYSNDYSAQVMELIEASVAEAKWACTRHPTACKPRAKKSAPAKVAAAKRKPPLRESA